MDGVGGVLTSLPELHPDVIKASIPTKAIVENWRIARSPKLYPGHTFRDILV
jgi:hypothetical protein